jgi:hypothetical protein
MPGKASKATLLIISLASLLLFSGCSEDRSNLLPADTAAQFDANLVLVQQLSRDGDCFGALNAAEEVRNEVEALGRDVDPTLRRNLLDGVTQLQIITQETCVEADSASTVEPVLPETPQDSGVSEPEPEPNATGSTGATGATGATDQPAPAPETDPAPTPDPAPAPTPTPPDTGSGGVGPSTGGMSPRGGGN